MDRCYDLLEVKAKEIAILDDKDGQIHLKGLYRVPIGSMSEFYEVFSRGIQPRKVAHTQGLMMSLAEAMESLWYLFPLLVMMAPMLLLLGS